MIVMQSIKNVSRNGRTVMVTIHQPSIDIFETFDALVLLRRGGMVSAHLYMPTAGYDAQGIGPWVIYGGMSLTVHSWHLCEFWPTSVCTQQWQP